MPDIDWTLYAGCVQAAFPYVLAAFTLAGSVIGLVFAVRGALPMPRRSRGRHRAAVPVVEGDHSDTPTLALRRLAAGLDEEFARLGMPPLGARALVQQADRKRVEL